VPFLFFTQLLPDYKLSFQECTYSASAPRTPPFATFRRPESSLSKPPYASERSPILPLEALPAPAPTRPPLSSEPSLPTPPARSNEVRHNSPGSLTQVTHHTWITVFFPLLKIVRSFFSFSFSIRLGHCPPFWKKISNPPQFQTSLLLPPRTARLPSPPPGKCPLHSPTRGPMSITIPRIIQGTPCPGPLVFTFPTATPRLPLLALGISPFHPVSPCPRPSFSYQALQPRLCPFLCGPPCPLVAAPLLR